MEKRVKLGKKKLETLQNLQKRKTELNTEFQQLMQNESLVVGFVLEDSGIDESEVASVKLEQEELVITLKEELPTKKLKKA